MQSPLLHRLFVQARIDELLRAGVHAARVAGPPPPAVPVQAELSVTLRYGFPDDAEPLGRLAALDSAVPPEQPVLVAEVGGELRAALSLSDGSVIAHPFYGTAPVVELLRARARQLDDVGRSGRRRLGSRFKLLAWR
jgi:hypothetical protein